MDAKQLLDMVSLALYGRTVGECHENGQCMTCGNPAGSFSTHKKAMGWAIAAMCERCQDKTKAAKGEPEGFAE